MREIWCTTPDRRRLRGGSIRASRPDRRWSSCLPLGKTVISCRYSEVAGSVHRSGTESSLDSSLEGDGFELPVPGIRSSIFIPPRRHSSLFGELAERVRHRVRRLKPRPTAPACHVESPIDDFLLPLSPRRVRVFMHTRTEVRRRARGGRWLGTEETSLNTRVPGKLRRR